MTAQDIRSKIDALWLHFFTGGITNPINVIEQTSYLMFIRMLDQTRPRRKETAIGQPMENSIFGEKRQHLPGLNPNNLGAGYALRGTRRYSFS